MCGQYYFYFCYGYEYTYMHQAHTEIVDTDGIASIVVVS